MAGHTASTKKNLSYNVRPRHSMSTGGSSTSKYIPKVEGGQCQSE